MKPSAEWKRKLAYIESRQDRFLVPRDGWTERDWRAQRQHDKEQRDRRAKLIADMDRPLVMPVTPTVAGFSLADRTRDQERLRRIEANRLLEKYGARPRRPW